MSHGILLYNPSYDDTYFVVRFLGGLKEDIRAAIALHQPKDVQTASTLALLQEEELEQCKKKGLFHSDNREPPKHSSKPSFSDKGKVSARKEDSNKEAKQDKDDKLSSLLAHRKKLGLCFKCGD